MKIQQGKLYQSIVSELVVIATKTLGDKNQRSFRGVVVYSDKKGEIGCYSETWSVENFEEVVEIKTEYTKQEIEAEVETRVRFKMNELLTGLKNRSKHNWQNAFNSGNPKYQHYMEAQNEMVGMFNKELEMSFSYEFNEKKQKEDRINMDKVIDNIIERFKLRGRFHGPELRTILYNQLKTLIK